MTDEVKEIMKESQRLTVRICTIAIICISIVACSTCLAMSYQVTKIFDYEYEMPTVTNTNTNNNN